MADHMESPAVATRAVSYIAAAIVAAVAGSVGLLAVSFPHTISLPPPAQTAFPEPSVTTDERTERLQLEKAQEQRLTGSNGGVPIDRAMSMIVARGANAFGPVVEGAP
jgi:hypothetical protein